MSILLDSRNQSRQAESNVREGIVQQPGPFYNGNPSSSIWGRGSDNFWKNAGGSGFMDPPPPPPVDTLKTKKPAQPEIFVFGSVGTTSTSADTAPPPSQADQTNGPSTSDHVQQVGSMLDKMRIQTEATSSVNGQTSTNTFTVGSKSTHQHSQANPRPRFSKLRKSTHQAKARGIESEEEEVKLAEIVDIFKSGRFTVTPPVHSVEPPSVEEPSVDRAEDVVNTNDVEGGSGSGLFGDRKTGTSEQPQEQVRKTDAFTFTAMRTAASEAQVLNEETNSVAASLAALKLPQVSQPTHAAAQADVPTDSPATAETPRTEHPQTEAEAGNGDAGQGPFAFAATPADIRSAFVFSAPGYAAATAGKKKKDKLRKTSSRLKPTRSSSSSTADDQGSPMDISPCPQTPDPEQEHSNVSQADLEALQKATVDLKLGTGPEEPNRSSSAFEPFSFTASSCPPTTSQRRPRKAASKAKPRPKPSLFDKGKAWAQLHRWTEQAEQSASVPASSRVDAEQACESWRLRGNEAYASGDFPKAEECYSLGASSVPDNETSQRCIRALMLCYSNRAATRMAVGRMADALNDCLHALSLDPNFLRARVRAGSCHLALGEPDRASIYFKECLTAMERHEQNDLKIAAEASDGLNKAQQVQEYMKSIWELASHDNFQAALRLTNEALVVSPHAETLLEMKARCLLMLHKLDEAVELCDNTLSQSETNWASKRSPKHWRSWVNARALFYLGKLEESLECVRKLGDTVSLSGTDKISDVLGVNMQTLSKFNELLHVLLQHKAAGNEAFQAGKHTEAIEHYTAALTCNSEVRLFNAVLFCNRAAAFQALDNIADAIADASRAVVLETQYAKAISRRATLHTLIRDYSQACTDLQRLTSLLSSQTKGKTSHDLKEARERLAIAEEELKKGYQIDHYRVLGLNPACTAVEIKKAYRKLALRHHPDKAGQSQEVMKVVADETRDDADRLFKLIGEAYAVLSDPVKRARYDAEEELRKVRTRGASASSSHPQHGSRYERNGRRQRDGWDAWSGFYAQRWQSGQSSDYDAAQPDYYAARQSRKSSDFKAWSDI